MISGRFPTIFNLQNVAENLCASVSSRFEEVVNFQQPNVDDNISSEIDGSILPSIEINSDIHADLQSSNDYNLLDDRENISVLEDDNDNNLSFLGDETDQIFNSNDPSTE